MSNLESFGKFVGKKIGETIRKRVENFELNIDGLENLKQLNGKSFLLACNHVKPKSKNDEQSQLGPDAFILERIVKDSNNQRLGVLAKADNGRLLFGEEGKNFQKQIEKPFRGIIKGIGMIPVNKNPGSLNREMLEEIELAVNRKEPVLIFPEGMWKDDFDPEADLEPGAAHIAKKFNLPILTAYIRNANEWKKDQEVSVSFGEIINPSDFEKDDVTEKIKQGIAELQKKSNKTK